MILARLASRLAALTAVRLHAQIDRQLQQNRANIAEEALRLALARVAADYGKRLAAVEAHLRASDQQPDKTPQQARLAIRQALSDIRVIRHQMQGNASDAARPK